MSLRSLAAALRDLKCTTGNIRDEINTLFETIKNSRPKLVILGHAIQTCEQEIGGKGVYNYNDVERAKEAIIACVERCIQVLNEKMDRVAAHGVEQIKDGDRIIVHSVNEPVQRIIPAAKRRNKQFKVLILRQDPNKTERVMRYLSREGIEYSVAREHGFSHFAEQADKLFIGAVAITGDDKVLCAAGTCNIVSIAHLYKLPVYLFLNSLKFSPLPSEDHHINEKEREGFHAGIRYTELSHSHDLVDLHFINHVFTEDGEVGPERINEYRKMSAEP